MPFDAISCYLEFSAKEFQLIIKKLILIIYKRSLIWQKLKSHEAGKSLVSFGKDLYWNKASQKYVKFRKVIHFC